MYSRRNQTVHNEAGKASESYLLQNFLILFRKSARSNHNIQAETLPFFIATGFDRVKTRIQCTLVFEPSLEESSNALYIAVEIPSLYHRGSCRRGSPRNPVLTIPHSRVMYSPSVENQ